MGRRRRVVVGDPNSVSVVRLVGDGYVVVTPRPPPAAFLFSVSSLKCVCVCVSLARVCGVPVSSTLQVPCACVRACVRVSCRLSFSAGRTSPAAPLAPLPMCLARYAIGRDETREI